jgi:hypothetical protein
MGVLKGHLLRLLPELRDEFFLIKIKKCSFMKEELVYLGFVILEKGLKMDPKKVKSIVE